MIWNNYCTNNHFFWYWPFGFFFILFIVIGISRMFWWRVSRRRYGDWYGNSHHDALGTLKKRFASGKITKEEFESIRKELEK